MKLLGILTFNVILGFTFAYTGFFGNKCFLDNFLAEQILSISATIFGFIFSGIVFLVGYLLQIKDKNFSKTKTEIKHNICFMGICFILIIFLLFLNPIPFESKNYDFMYYWLIMTIFFLQFYGAYEIINGILTLLDKNK